MKHVAILGSTGSIGIQALDVVSYHPDRFKVTALAAYQNDVLMAEQIERFQPALAVLIDEAAAARLRRNYHGSTRIAAGQEGLLEAATLTENDIVLTAMVGAAGIRPTLAAIEAGKDIALANKETLVAAGSIVTAAAARKACRLLPVDSEHSALFQCLQGEKADAVARLILTASGGPFRGYSRRQLERITVEQCLQHPNWSMGRKITVDSATMVNKGLEVIEARWLYDIAFERIEVVIHPQSIVHSMIEFVDGSTMAQLGLPDMRLPIQYALTWPDRLPSPAPSMDWRQARLLEFLPPDTDTFRGLALAYEAGETGGTMPCVLNAANEVAVEAFLQKHLPFLAIPEIIGETMSRHSVITAPSLPEILLADVWAREVATGLTETFRKKGG